MGSRSLVSFGKSRFGWGADFCLDLGRQDWNLSPEPVSISYARSAQKLAHEKLLAA